MVSVYAYIGRGFESRVVLVILGKLTFSTTFEIALVMSLKFTPECRGAVNRIWN